MDEQEKRRPNEIEQHQSQGEEPDPENEWGSETLLEEQMPRQLSTFGFDKNLGVVSSTLEFSNDDVCLTFPTKKTLVIPRKELKASSLEVISHPFYRWLEKLDPAFQPHFYDPYVPSKSTPALQVVTSLFHIAYELLSLLDKKSARGDSVALIEALYGMRLEDLLPPRNKLLVPSSVLQAKIRNEDPQSILFRLGRLYRCKAIFESEEVLFHYRPYNTPIAGIWELKSVGNLNDALKKEYERLLVLIE